MKPLVSIRTRGLIFNDQGQVLLAKTNHNQTWCAPGGTAEPGETVGQTLLREIKEEVGLEVKLGRLVIIHDLLETSTGEQRINFWFECVTSEGLPANHTDPDGKVEEVRFFDQTEICELPDKVFPDWLREEFWEWHATGFTTHQVYQPEIYDVFPFRQSK